jgi:hypothetical protein
MNKSKPKYEPPKIIPKYELAEAAGSNRCRFGKGASTCSPGNGGIASAS